MTVEEFMTAMADACERRDLRKRPPHDLSKPTKKEKEK